jgi:hypothetical protein
MHYRTSRGQTRALSLAQAQAFIQEGSGGRCSGWDALRLRGSLGYAGRCLLYRSLCPAALRPLGLASPPQSPQHARPDPPQARGLAHPRGAPPLRSSGRGRAAAARVGTLCATAGRWGSPANALVAHGCLPLRTLWICVPPWPPSRGPGVRSSLALSGALSTAPWRLTPAPPLVRC